ncbi:hypothetical protein EMIHUDRAFT_229439 [Emiliania huxleyi CCMP1516]|uniref:5-hmdU DNA kinase helical domain-containing protein n=2 Tax=Emiliania huxleyi TaxID=2903 RepID=A0A0D3KD61_EMIH1|nr:hypothetical protein EMIHUDRAFT_229439 [Emiliania huxleyi CCMP1516]EOD33696.1 hypothetical protein EMIHUDRAFT_229439 [Emiliania huxleyi CCMP1516]|eukprot:XP_005786125.1 hypothetical protein EMIHUDRAFT_229439 [Emiliania huxleyi CCMP1516]
MKRPSASKAASSSPQKKGKGDAPPRLGFYDFVAERQAVLQRRRRGLDASEWTSDPILAKARFCNIDRKDDAVTRELLTELERPSWKLPQQVMLAAALRFTGSRRGEAQRLARLIDEDVGGGALAAALESNDIKCGVGTYQMTLNRRQVGSRIASLGAAVADRVSEQGAFGDMAEASDFVAEAMTFGARPQFSANETAKAFARAGRPRKPQKIAIDVEQALCEFAKYEAYRSTGITPMKRFSPATGTETPAAAKAEAAA